MDCAIKPIYDMNFDNQYFIIPHIPKTGGTTLRKHFNKYLKRHIEFLHIAHRGKRDSEKSNIKYYCDANLKQRNKVKVAFGHLIDKNTHNLFSKQPKYILLFRDPKTWEISRYNQRMNNFSKKGKKIISFKEWIDQEPTHSQFDWFLIHFGKYTKKSLSNLEYRDKLYITEIKKFKFLINLENLDNLIQPIYHALNLPLKSEKFNVTGKHKINFFDKSNENLDLLKKLTEHEYYLYNYLLNHISDLK